MDRSEKLFARAEKVIPGGVNSPVRAFRSVGSAPRFLERGLGSRVWDADGRQYTDYIGSWGPLILGHAFPPVVAAVKEAAERGTSFGLPTELEVEMAELVCSLIPGLDKVRMVSSGTEAVLSALRLARGFTGRSLTVKFEGCYHGHADSMLVKAGSGLATAGQPDSAGVSAKTASETLTCPYNDIERLESLFSARGDDIAALIVEPVAANMGVVPPHDGFLGGLRELTRRYGAVLIFDEVITGFRLGLSGAAGYFGVTPDLWTFGKIIGGGLPVGAYGGRKDIMDRVAPLGPVYQAGTLSGNPLAMAAGLAALKTLQERPQIYEDLERLGSSLRAGLTRVFADVGIPAQVQGIGSLATVFFTGREVRCYDDAQSCDRSRYARYFNGLLRRGILTAPSQFEALFLSAAHNADDVAAFLKCAAETAGEIRD